MQAMTSMNIPVTEFNADRAVTSDTSRGENFVWGLKRQEPVAVPGDLFNLAYAASNGGNCCASCC